MGSPLSVSRLPAQRKGRFSLQLATVPAPSLDIVRPEGLRLSREIRRDDPPSCNPRRYQLFEGRGHGARMQAAIGVGFARNREWANRRSVGPRSPTRGRAAMQSTEPDVQPVNGHERTVDLRARSPKPSDRLLGSTDRLLRWGITILLAVIGIVHLHLWQDGYHTLPTIGPLFLVAVVSAGSIALFTSVQLNWATATAAACFATATLAANLASLLLPHGLFEFKEVGVSYSGSIAIASEVGVVALFGTWVHRRLRNGRGPARRRFIDRTYRCCTHR